VHVRRSFLLFITLKKHHRENTGIKIMLYEDELKRALEEDGSSSSSFITPRSYYPRSI
jgi:hypothetical protein